MTWEVYKFKNIINNDKDSLLKKRISFYCYDSQYSFRIDYVGSEMLEVIGFFQYVEITSGGYIENQLREVISHTNDPFVLARVADERKHYIYNKLINVKIGDDDYEFKIEGIGPIAVKLALNVKHDDIIDCKGKMESMLKDMIEDVYSSKFNDNDFLDSLKREYDEKIRKEKEMKEEWLKEEAEKKRKREELDALLGDLNSSSSSLNKVKKF